MRGQWIASRRITSHMRSLDEQCGGDAGIINSGIDDRLPLVIAAKVGCADHRPSCCTSDPKRVVAYEIGVRIANAADC